jgi:hypothetical protein
MKLLKNSKKMQIILIIGSVLLPFAIALFRITTGNISFWYDPARDFFLALDNHQKIGLIGQTSGIPGIFYGPYWVWTLSLVLLIFKDPRFVAFVVLAVPYFTLFPYLLYRLSSIWGIHVSIALWLFFILSFEGYAIHLWNPHLAPLLTLVVIFLLVTADYNAKSFRRSPRLMFGGVFAGLLMNFHISFGLAVVIGSLMFLFVKKNIRAIILFGAGAAIVFLPFFVFEIRHGFNQITALVETLTSDTAVVSERSGGKLQILSMFSEQFATLLNIPVQVGYLLFGTVSAYMIYVRKKLKITPIEKSLIFLILFIAISTLSIYLSSKNPVWEYHFIGVEVLFLLFAGFAAKKLHLFRKLLFFLLIVLFLAKIQSFTKELSANPYSSSSLVAKQYVVDTIYEDAKGEDFSVFTYSPAHFTPDYDYILMWRGDVLHSDNYNKERREELVYLIIPWTTPDLRDDFIDNRTPNESYVTVRRWEIDNGTIVLRREAYENK